MGSKTAWTLYFGGYILPLYDYECRNCGPIIDVWAKIDEVELVCACGGTLLRLISPTRIQCDLQPYFDENLGDRGNPQGQWVKSRQHKRQLLKEQGLAEIG
jgi:putative FmdB family regulatory protein